MIAKCFETIFGSIYVSFDDNGALTNLVFLRNVSKEDKELYYQEKVNGDLQPFEILKQQVLEFCNKKRFSFSVSLNPSGTDFQKKVWENLLKIPYGQTISYEKLAIDMGNKKAVRAVGGANRVNPISLIIPCHRVIGKNGTLTGYAGGLDLKKQLLEFENERK